MVAQEKKGESLAEELNLVQKLAKIRALADIVSREKQGYGYKYADITEILAKITGGMKRYGVSLIPTIVASTASSEKIETRNTKVDKTGKPFENVSSEYVVSADMKFIWINDDNPDERIEVPWFVIGAQSDPSQAYGSGLTYCTRYFMTNYFQIAQDNDVDKFRSEQKKAETEEDRAVAKEITKQIDIAIKTFLEENPKKTEEIKKFASRYVKNGSYLSINDPQLAAKLLSDFQEKYANNKEEKGE